MKLSAAILFATANAQEGQGGRVRDKDVADVAAAFDSYNAGFGGDDAYGGFYDAFADAFGDNGNYGDYGYDNAYEAADVATAAPAAVDAGRPVEVAEDDDVKTVLIDGLQLAASDPNDGSFSQRCWVGRGTSAASWFETVGTDNGWQVCNGGEFQACEIKVVRNKANAITQVVSKCANQQSCADNMKQNFNPAVSQGASLYRTFANQQCRPQNLAGASADNFGARQLKQDSVCFFCVEPCSTDDTTLNGYDADDIRQAGCVGANSGGTTNSRPIPDSDVDILTQGDDSGLDANVYSEGALVASNFFNLNWYSTVDVTLTDATNDITETRTLSRIQQNQLFPISP